MLHYIYIGVGNNMHCLYKSFPTVIFFLSLVSVNEVIYIYT